MKILIITFTSGVNPGTFMQALGVQTAIKKIFCDATIEFLSFPDFKHIGGIGVRDKKDAIWHTVLQKGFAAYRLLKYWKLRKKHFIYSSPVDLFNYTSADEEIIKQYDLIVIGSDTILEQAYGNNGKIGLNWMPLDVVKIYFAASASPANYEAKKDLREVASAAKFIGLRDNLTVNFFISKLGVGAERIVKQPDPSYYIDVKKFKLSEKQYRKLKKGQKYALCNFMSNFPLRKELADALRGLGYKVVSTAYNPYADVCFDTIDAKEWAAVFQFMDIIVTERFHDSVFGLRNGKPVVAIDWDPIRFTKGGDSKTLCILEDYAHKHLHFNLCDKFDISPVINAVKSIDNLFDLNKVEEVNALQQEQVNAVLKKVKKELTGE